jgi:hypothetical protein
METYHVLILEQKQRSEQDQKTRPSPNQHPLRKKKSMTIAMDLLPSEHDEVENELRKMMTMR